MVPNTDNKVVVHVVYPCYICANEYSGASQVITHVQNIHGYVLEPRQVGHHRPSDNHYAFENDVKMKWDVQHFGCPSCWFHCPKNFESLMEHITQEHEPSQVPGFVPKNQDEVELQSEESDVQQLDIIPGEEEGVAKEGASDIKQQPDEEQTGKKEVAAPLTASGPFNIGSVVQDKARKLTETDSELAQEILQKITDLNDMFKNLFTKSS